MEAPRTILLVEDDPRVRGSLARLLKAEGWEVHEAATGRDGVARLDAMRPALLITDVNMPDLDGLELIRLVRRRDRDLPIIAMSVGGALPTGLTLEAAQLLGAHATFDKLSPPKELLELVARMLR